MKGTRGIWTPSGPVVVVAVALLAIGIVGAFLSIESVDPLGVEREVTTTYSEGVVSADGDTLVVTVLEANSEDPVPGATVVPTSGDANLESAPEATTDDDGEVTVTFGNDSDAVTIDWRTGQQSAEVSFDIEPPDGRTDRNPNPTVRVRRP